MKKAKTIILAWIGLVIVLIIIGGALYVGMIDYRSDFSKDKWEKYVEYRHYMIADLRNEYELVGLSEDEIKNLLGEPTQIEDRIDGYYAYHYHAGSRSGVDTYVLEIVFKDGVSVHVAEGEH